MQNYKHFKKNRSGNLIYSYEQLGKIKLTLKGK